MCDVDGETCLSKKIFTIRLNMHLPLRARVKKTVYVVETFLLSGKKNVLGEAVSK